MPKSITYIGLAVHKDTIAVALAEAGLRGEVREHGKIPNTPTALKALTVKLVPARRELRFCYEAGPCGYGIQRQLAGAGHECAVVAPSLIPRKPGERINTDRRDAINLAKLHRAGELTPVWVAGQAHEAIRDPRVKPEDKPSPTSAVSYRRVRFFNRLGCKVGTTFGVRRGARGAVPADVVRGGRAVRPGRDRGERRSAGAGRVAAQLRSAGPGRCC
jgi:hypothetical protein